MKRRNFGRTIAHAANSTYPKGGGFPMKNRDRLCCADTFVVAESSVLRMKFSGKNPAPRVAANVISNCRRTSVRQKLDNEKKDIPIFGSRIISSDQLQQSSD